MIFFNDRVAVVSLEVVSQNSQRAVFGKGVQVGEELLDTSVAFKNLRWNQIRLGFGYYQIRDMATPLLHAFNVKEDMQDLFAVSVLIILFIFILRLRIGIMLDTTSFFFPYLDETLVFGNENHLATRRALGMSTPMLSDLFKAPQQLVTEAAPTTRVTDVPVLRIAGCSSRGLG